ncbi:MAG TPA: hypothetical protein GX716_03075 [Firmicutes bacterium]|nr:hypothetical protein [Candidatus Fermentithermobacillaceae bacterium]
MYRKKMARVLVALALTFIMVFGGLAGVVLAESGEGGEVPLVPAGPTDASVGEEVYGQPSDIGVGVDLSFATLDDAGSPSDAWADIDLEGSIAAAITAAHEGDTIQLADGVYSTDITVDKAVTLEAVNKHGAVITGKVTVSANNVTLKDLKFVRQDGVVGPLITVGAYDGVKLVGNYVDGNEKGSEGANYAGIKISSSGINIEDNDIVGNKGNGIWVDAGRDCSITVDGNNIVGNRTGINFNSCTGAASITVKDNLFKDNTAHGISIGANTLAATFVVEDNEFSGNIRSHFSDRRYDGKDDTTVAPGKADIESNNEFDGKTRWTWDDEDDRWLCVFKPPVHNTTKGAYYNTIQEAVNAADPSDIIEVDGGEYDVTYEGDSIDHYLWVKKPVTIKAADMDDKPVLRANYVGTMWGGQQQTVFITADDVMLDGLIIHSITSYPTSFTKAVEIENANNVTIRNCSIYDEGRTAIYIGGTEVRKYTITDNHLEGAIVVANGAGAAMNPEEPAVISGNSIWASISFTGKTNSGWDPNSIHKYPAIQDNVIYGTSLGMVINSRDSDAGLLMSDDMLTSIVGENEFPNGTPQLVVDSYEYYNAPLHRKRLMLDPPVYNATKGTYYLAIQDAIDAAADGDTIEVAPGKYEESVIRIYGKGLTLASRGKHGAVIEGRVDIRANSVTLDGFTIVKQESCSAITIGWSEKNDHSGIFILNNLIDGNGQGGAGITPYFSEVTIKGNIIKDNLGNGVYTFASGSKKLIFEDNRIEGNRTGINFDEHTLGSTVIDIENNEFIGNRVYGVSIGDGQGTFNIVGNTFEGNIGGHFMDHRTAGQVSPPDVSEFLSHNTINGDPVQVYTAGTTKKWLVADRPDIYNSNRYTSHESINEAIEVAQPGDTIMLNATTFVGTEQLHITKDLTIVGRGAGETVIKTSTSFTTGGKFADTAAWILVDDKVNFTLRGVTFDGSGQSISNGVLCHGRSLIEDCEFKNIAHGKYLGIAVQFYGDDGSTVSGCSFSNIGRIGVYVGHDSYSVTIEGNTYQGKGAIDCLDYAFEVGRGGKAVIRRNTISGNRGIASTDGSTSAGILVTTYFEPYRAEATILRNMITDCTEAVAVGYAADDQSAVVVRENVFYNNEFAINSTDAHVDAELNYWGVVKPVGDLFIGDVDFEPWYLDEDMDIRSDKLKLTVSVSGEGGVKKDPPGPEYSYGDVVKLTPAPGWRFSSWSSNVAASEGYLEVTMDWNKTVALTLSRVGETSGGGGGPSGPVLPPVIAPSVTAPIDTTTGGTVELEDGSAAVEMPPNATEEEVTVTLAPVTEVTQPTTGMVMIAGKVYEITAETSDGELVTQFSRPLTLTFRVTEEELEETEAELEDLRVFYWDEKAGAWIALPTTVDPETGTVTALTDHFTVFALMAKPDMPALNDIPGHWAEKYILRLVSLGVVGGYEDGSYRPEAGITRQEFAKMVVLAAGLEADAEPELTFADAGEIAGWARGYVSAAVNAGIITGVGDNRFAPADPVTRAQAATMIIRALGIEASGTPEAFADGDAIPEWALSSIQAAVEKAIIDGFEDNTFRPDLNATRAQAAKMLSRLTEVRFED